MSIDASQWPSRGDAVHVLVTSNGTPYLNFQTRILYRTYLRARAMPGGDKMVAFTRILSRAGERAGVAYMAHAGSTCTVFDIS